MIAVIQNIWWLLVLIGVMILIHELGHFWAARAFNIKVDVFSFGFGPRLFGFRRGEVDYRFSAILFGGYVKMAGEQPGEGPSEDPRAFSNKPRWQRLIVAAAGPFMNILLAVGILTGLYMVSYERIVDAGGSIIGHVVADSPAAKAGVQPGDKIVKLNSKVDPDWEDILTTEISSAERPLAVVIERAGKQIPITVTPVLDEKEGMGSSGWEGQNEIQVGAVTSGMPAATAGLKKGDLLLKVNGVPIHSRYTLPELIRKSDGKPVTLEYLREGGQPQIVSMKPVFSDPDGKPRWMIGVAPSVKFHIQKQQLGLVDAFRQSLVTNGRNASLIVQVMQGIVERRMSAKNLEGPVAIAKHASDAAQEGPSAFLSLMCVVSLNLAIFNLLPIPILDGGMILTLLIEMVMGRDLSLGMKENMLKVGFVFLMMLVVFVLYNDIAKRIMPGTIISKGHVGSPSQKRLQPKPQS